MIIKICGLTTVDAIHATAEAGADWMGLVFYPRSPRHLEPEAATALLRSAGRPLPVVAVMVAPEESLLKTVMTTVRPEFLQVHGDWTPAQLRAAAERYQVQTIRALSVATATDLAEAAAWQGAADWLLLDAKPPPGGLPGGNRLTFDWRILAGWQAPLPWLLAGGLDPETVGAAVRQTCPAGVDVSSGVESAPGGKDTNLIRAFVAAAR